jgi:bacterial/archaeal transporter family protein
MQWLFWALLSALFAGSTAVLAKIGVTGLNSNVATAIRTAVVLLLATAISVVTHRPSDLASIAFRGWFFLAVSGVATGLSWLCYFRALQLAEVAKVAPIDKLSVVVALILSMVFLGETLTLRETFGALLIVIGAIVIAIG